MQGRHRNESDIFGTGMAQRANQGRPQQKSGAELARELEDQMRSKQQRVR